MMDMTDDVIDIEDDLDDVIEEVEDSSEARCQQSCIAKGLT